MQSNVETGLQLIMRLRKAPCVSTFDDALFFNGLRNTDTVEITGDASSAKSLLLTKMIAKCILPDWHDGVHIKGLAASAVLINTDCHFQITKLIKIMSAIVTDAYESSTKRVNKRTINRIVNDVLDNLIVVNCYDNDQFLLTLHTLENILFRHEKIAILAIDSISAYYWQNRESKGIWSIDLYVKSLVKIIHTTTSQFNVVTIYTKPSNSLSKNTEPMKSVTNRVTKELNYIIHLYRNTNSEKHSCVIQSTKGTRTINYMINAGVIIWITEGD